MKSVGLIVLSYNHVVATAGYHKYDSRYIWKPNKKQLVRIKNSTKSSGIFFMVLILFFSSVMRNDIREHRNKWRRTMTVLNSSIQYYTSHRALSFSWETQTHKIQDSMSLYGWIAPNPHIALPSFYAFDNMISREWRRQPEEEVAEVKDWMGQLGKCKETQHSSYTVMDYAVIIIFKHVLDFA